MSIQERRESVGTDEHTMRGNGSGEPTPQLSGGQEEAYRRQPMSQQEIDEFNLRFHGPAKAEPPQHAAIRLPGGRSLLVSRLKKMDFDENSARQYAARILQPNPEVLEEAVHELTLARHEPNYDALTGWSLQPDAVIADLCEKRRRR